MLTFSGKGFSSCSSKKEVFAKIGRIDKNIRFTIERG
jgi:hypothetical protein